MQKYERLGRKAAKEYAAANSRVAIVTWAAAKGLAPALAPLNGLESNAYREAFADELERLGFALRRGIKPTQSLAARSATGRVRRLLNLRAEASAALDRVSEARGLSLSDTVSDLVIAADSQTRSY